MDNQLKVIGKIDLDAINNNGRPRLYQQNNDGRFRLLSMSVSFGQCDAVSFDFGIKVDELVFNYRYFSLFIGNNGVGKSSGNYVGFDPQHVSCFTGFVTPSLHKLFTHLPMGYSIRNS